MRVRVERGELFLHGWHYIIEEGKVLVLDVASGSFVGADRAAAGVGSGGDESFDLLQ